MRLESCVITKVGFFLTAHIRFKTGTFRNTILSEQRRKLSVAAVSSYLASKRQHRQQPKVGFFLTAHIRFKTGTCRNTILSEQRRKLSVAAVSSYLASKRQHRQQPKATNCSATIRSQKSSAYRVKGRNVFAWRRKRIQCPWNCIVCGTLWYATGPHIE